MPRRNRNADSTPVRRDMLANQAVQLARALATPVLCAGCEANPATDGDYCTLCKGLIIFSARRTALGRR
jgi:hypothetical protein